MKLCMLYSFLLQMFLSVVIKEIKIPLRTKEIKTSEDKQTGKKETEEKNTKETENNEGEVKIERTDEVNETSTKCVHSWVR